jgi:hypothetical protein
MRATATLPRTDPRDLRTHPLHLRTHRLRLRARLRLRRLRPAQRALQRPLEKRRPRHRTTSHIHAPDQLRIQPELHRLLHPPIVHTKRGVCMCKTTTTRQRTGLLFEARAPAKRGCPGCPAPGPLRARICAHPHTQPRRYARQHARKPAFQWATTPIAATHHASGQPTEQHACDARGKPVSSLFCVLCCLRLRACRALAALSSGVCV